MNWRLRRQPVSCVTCLACACEFLEQRVFLANVTWDGGANGNWNVATNWTGDALPGSLDDVFLTGGVEVTVDSAVPTIRSIMASGGSTLSVSAGSLTITNGGFFNGGIELSGGVFTASTVEPHGIGIGGGIFSMSGGTLFGNVGFTTGAVLTWTGGEMASPGKTSAQGATASFSSVGGPTVILSRLLDWGGRGLSVSGSVEMRTGSIFDVQTMFGYLLSLTDAIITDGGGAGPLRSNNGLILTGDSFISVESELTGQVIGPGGVSTGTVHLLGGGTGNVAVQGGPQVRIGGPGFALTGASGQEPLDGQVFFDEGESTFVGVADELIVAGDNARLSITDSSTLNQLTIGAGGHTTVETGVTTVNGPIDLSGTALMTLQEGGNVLVRAHALHVAGPQARVNMSNNAMIIDYVDSIGSPLPAIEALINSARNFGAWDGPGITSTAARDNPLQNTTLGAMEGSDYIPFNGTTFEGQTVDADSVLVKYTYYGDATLNGQVDFDDYVLFDTGFNNGFTGWFNGDFDLNGQIDFDDVIFLDLGFNTQGAPL